MLASVPNQGRNAETHASGSLVHVCYLQGKVVPLDAQVARVHSLQSRALTISAYRLIQIQHQTPLKAIQCKGTFDFALSQTQTNIT